MYQQDPEVGQIGVNPEPNLDINSQFFGSKQIRHNFIKKVYSLLSVQLIITVAIIALFAVHPDVHQWALKNRWFHTASFVVSFVILIAITCMGKLRRKHPHNLIILFAFTVAEALMLAAITVMFDTKIVMLAGAITTVVCLALTLFAVQTKWDFTAKSGIMLVILMVATVTMLIGLFFPPSKPFILIMSSIMAIIMGIFLVIDTQMIVGGTHAIQMSPEEYVFAAINLYLDIINMFLYILMILGKD